MESQDLRTTVALHDLGTVRPEWSGILSPLYQDDTVTTYIHEQFLEDSSEYVARYQNLKHFEDLLREAQRHFEANPKKILDIGSGAGNTIFPLLDLYPDASIVASDLSIPLLKALKEYYDARYVDRNCTIIQLNAEAIIFEPSQFDLVVGGSILHHLLDPEKTLTQCCRVLKPGACAIFFEPFEIGNQILALGLKHIVDIDGHLPESAARLSPEVVTFFKAIIHDYEVRKGVDKSDPKFLHMDDKWLFTARYFDQVARAAGFREVETYSINDVYQPFSRQVPELLRLGLPEPSAALPSWAVAYLVALDEHFSPELRQDLIMEGCVLFRK